MDKMEVNSTETTLLTSKSILKSSIYSAGSKYLKTSRRNIPSIPKAANWGWSHLPWPPKIMIAGVLFGVISVTTPYWVHVRFYSYSQSTFGLFHYCNGESCTSIHDNLVEGRSVDVWFHLVQGNMCIGVACSIVSLAVMTNSLEGDRLRMSPTTIVAAASILAISAFEQMLGLTIFVKYIDDLDFLFNQGQVYSLDFYGSFYMGIVSTVCSIVCAFVIFINNNFYRKHLPKKVSKVNDENEKLLKIYKDYLDSQNLQYYNTFGYSNNGYEVGPGDAFIDDNLRHEQDEAMIKRKKIFEEDFYGDSDFYNDGFANDDMSNHDYYDENDNFDDDGLWENECEKDNDGFLDDDS